jgi:hypothetical protein
MTDDQVVKSSPGRLAVQLHLYDTRAHRSLQCRMVALGLVGISECEFAHRLVKPIALPEIPGNRPRVACLGMRAR